MSILNSLATSNDRFIIPCAGKMFRSTLEKRNQALAYCINKGYFEFEELSDLLILVDQLINAGDFVLVGTIDKIILSDGSCRYRQRIFFKSLVKLIEYCRKNGLSIEVSEGFRISINNVMNCLDELIFLERYAKAFEQCIDEYLTYTCLVRLDLLFKQSNISYILNINIDEILLNKHGYLDRAPFIISEYSIDNKTSSIFLDDEIDDIRLYSMKVDKYNSLFFGYTSSNVKTDIEKRCFN